MRARPTRERLARKLAGTRGRRNSTSLPGVGACREPGTASSAARALVPDLQLHQLQPEPHGVASRLAPDPEGKGSGNTL